MKTRTMLLLGTALLLTAPAFAADTDNKGVSNETDASMNHNNTTDPANPANDAASTSTSSASGAAGKGMVETDASTDASTSTDTSVNTDSSANTDTSANADMTAAEEPVVKPKKKRARHNEAAANATTADLNRKALQDRDANASMNGNTNVDAGNMGDGASMSTTNTMTTAADTSSGTSNETAASMNNINTEDPDNPINDAPSTTTSGAAANSNVKAGGPSPEAATQGDGPSLPATGDASTGTSNETASSMNRINTEDPKNPMYEAPSTSTSGAAANSNVVGDGPATTTGASGDMNTGN